jgi:hypothetical protein
MSPLSGVLGESWSYYKRFAGHFLLIAFVIYLVAAAIVALLSLAGAVGTFVGLIIGVIAAFLVQAALVKAVQDVRDGRADLNLGETVSAVVPYLPAVIAASILAGIGIAIGFALIIVPGLILLTFWSLIVPSIVIGGEGVFGSFSKSWRTVRGYAWHVFGTYVLVFLILIVFDIVLGLVLLALPIVARNFISNIVSGTLVAPFLALVVTLVYYRLTAAHTTPAAEPAWPAQPGPGPDAPPAGPGTQAAGPGAQTGTGTAPWPSAERPGTEPGSTQGPAGTSPYPAQEPGGPPPANPPSGPDTQA